MNLKTILSKAAAEYNRTCDVKLKKISEHGDYNLGAGIYRDPVTTEHVVFFVDGGEYLSRADYCTKYGLPDAEGTVDHFLNPNKGEPLMGTLTQQELDEARAEVKADDAKYAEEDARDAAKLNRPHPRGYYSSPSPLLKGLLMRGPQ